jgi:hypothetical protein
MGNHRNAGESFYSLGPGLGKSVDDAFPANCPLYPRLFRGHWLVRFQTVGSDRLEADKRVARR